MGSSRRVSLAATNELVGFRSTSVISPFVLNDDIVTGTAMWSNIAAGAVIAVLAAFAAFQLRSSPGYGAAPEFSDWLAALAGLCVLIAPFVVSIDRERRSHVG